MAITSMLTIYFITALVVLIILPILGRLNFISKEYYHSIILIYDFFTYKNFLFWILLFPFILWFTSLIFYQWNSVLVKHIWIVSLVFWILLYIYITVVLKRGILLSKSNFIIISILSVAATATFNFIFYNKGAESLLPQNNWWFWTASFFFVISSFWYKHKAISDNSGHRIEDFIKHRVGVFKKEFRLDETKDYKQSILLSILVVEDYNRPKIFRFFEKWLSYFGLAKTTGIAQMQGKALSDQESVNLLQQKIFNYFDDGKDPILSEVRLFLNEYNGGGYDEMVLAILQNIDRRFIPK